MTNAPALKRALKVGRPSWQVMDSAFYVANGFGLWYVDDPKLAEHLKLDANPLADGSMERIIAKATKPAKPTPVLVQTAGIVTRVFRTVYGPVTVNAELLDPASYKSGMVPDQLTWAFSDAVLVARDKSGRVILAAMEIVVDGSRRWAEDELQAAIMAMMEGEV